MAVIAVTLGALIWSYASHRRPPEEPRLGQQPIETEAEMSIGKVHQTATRDGVKEWDLVAESAKYDEERSQVEFDRVAATFFLKDNQEVSLNADRGILQTDSKDMAVSGNVVVANRGYRLQTEALTYRHSQRQILSRAPVEISGNAFRLTAERLTLDLETEEAQLEGKVSGSFHENLKL